MVVYKPLGDSSLRVFQGVIVLDSNGVNVLVDVGWDELLSPKHLDKLVRLIPQIDLILLTHPTIGHAGAFCYLRHKYPEFRAIPAYATLPVIRMSQMMTLDVYRTAGLCGAFDDPEAMSSSEVDAIWSEVNNAKYSQPLHLHFNAKVEGTVITAYNAGHSLGGSLWKISDGIDNIVVAFDWNHARDAHLSGAFLETKTGTVVTDLQKPSILITSTNVNSGLPLTKARQYFLDCLDSALSKGGTILIPTSAGSRILELMLILDKQVSTKKIRVPLIYCSYHGKQTMTQASSMLEWMVPSIISDWQVQNESPFDTRNVSYVTDPSAINDRWPQRSKIILADGEALESGPSKEIFLSMIAGDNTSSVIFTEICPPDTLASKLLSSVTSNNNGLSPLGITLPNVQLPGHEFLRGAALEEYKERQAKILKSAQEEVEQSRRNKELIDATAVEEAAELSESEDDQEEEQESLDGPATLLGDNGVYDYICHKVDGNHSGAKMFPFFVKKRKIDDYGSFLPHDMFSTKKTSKEEPLGSKSDDATAVREYEEMDVDKDRSPSANDSTTDAVESDIKSLSILEAADQEKPMKLVTKRLVRVKVLCWIANTDLNGLTNLRSLQMILKQIQPTKVIALPGSDPVVNYLQSAFKTFALADKEVSLERTDFSIDVRLDPALKIEWHNLFGGYSVARVAGRLEFDPHSKIKRFSATLVSPDEHFEEPDRQKTTIGDLKLTSLRKVLMETGIKAEFRGQNLLVCNDSILVKRSENGTYLLDGGLNEDYYRVRAAIRRFVTTI